jgi:hypothetical protein
MALQKEGNRLRTVSLDLISNEIIRRLKNQQRTKLIQVQEILEAFDKFQYANPRLNTLLYSIMLETPETDFSLKTMTTSCQILIRNKFEIHELLDKMFKTFENSFENRPLDVLIQLLYVLTFPRPVHLGDTKAQAQKIMAAIKSRLEQDYKHAINILSINYTSVKSENFAELHLWAFNKIKDSWQTLSIYDKSNYTLNYVSSKTFHDEWS